MLNHKFLNISLMSALLLSVGSATTIPNSTHKKIQEKSLVTDSTQLQVYQNNWDAEIYVRATRGDTTYISPAVEIGINENATIAYDPDFDRLAPPSKPFSLENVLTDGHNRMNRNIADVIKFRGEINPINIAIDNLFIEIVGLPEDSKYVLFTYIGNFPSQVAPIRNSEEIEITGSESYLIVEKPFLMIDSVSEEKIVLETEFLADTTLAVYSTNDLKSPEEFTRIGVMSKGDLNTYRFERTAIQRKEYYYLRVEP